VVVNFHKENLTFTADSNNPINQLMMQMMGAFSEFERSLIRERQREGIDKALAKGTKFGASPKFTSKQIEEIKIKKASGSSVISIAGELNVSRQTIYTILKSKS
jgi:DNA invertase Pin-like site-specific DNA recombinase